MPGAQQIIPACQPKIARHFWHKAVGVPDILVFRLCAADKEVQIQIFPVEPLHLVFDDTMLQKNLFAPGADAFRGKVVVHYQVRRTGLHMGAHQIIGAVVQQIMPEAAPLHCTAQCGDLCSVRAVGGDDIIGAQLRVLRAQIPVEPVAVVAGIGAALAHQPDAPVCRNKGAAYRPQQLA